MRIRRHVRQLAAALAVLAAPLALDAQADADRTTRHTLAGDDVAIYDVAGTVRVVGGGSGEVTVEVARRGADASRLDVRTGPVGARQALRVVFPDDRITYPGHAGRRYNTTMTVREDGTFGDGGTGGRRIRISSDDDGMEAWADLTITVPRGKRVALYLGVGEAEVSNVDGDLTVDVAAASVSATGTSGRLRLDTGSGSVKVSDASGEVDLDTGSGSVTLDRIRATRLTVDAGSGSIRGEEVSADAMRFDLGSGSTHLRAVRSPGIILDSGSGSVDLELAGDVDDLRLDSGSGRITLRVPRSLGAQVDVDTGSGGIDADVEMTIQRRSRSTLQGTIGDGRGRIVIESGSGGVRIVAGK